MADTGKKGESPPQYIFTPEQDALLDLYLDNLDNYLEEIKTSEKIQVEIETLHLKRILTK
ncbi:hypothetical protein [Pontibacter chitinilyticus]|uniref:hypothetical protein n=1 Tax=Pontibacter chitinilyticus TaxID=2674989 RepID=UPI0032194BF3